MFEALFVAATSDRKLGAGLPAKQQAGLTSVYHSSSVQYEISGGYVGP